MIKNDRGLLPTRVVKPLGNVLTHVIEGHVIQEADKPFPVNRQRYSDDSNEPPSKRQKSTSPEKGDRLSCIQCGKAVDGKGKHNKKKKYCSPTCEKAAKSRIKNDAGDRTEASSPSSLPSPSSSSSSISSVTNGTAPAPPTTNGTTEHKKIVDNAMDQDEQASFLVKWTVDEVCDYIRKLDGYSDYAEDFSLHEIDGQALVLLNENHLVQTMGIKLGPALKIMSKIDAIKNSGVPMEQQ